MEPHTIELPRKILVGAGALDSLGKICAGLGLNGRCLLLTGPHVVRIAGMRALKALADAGIQADLELIGSTDKEDLARIAALTAGYGSMIGVGGGKIIDVAKWASTKANIPFVSIPTAPSHDGIASPRATIFDSEGQHHSYAANVPAAILVDMDIIAASPYRMIAAGAADIIAKLTAVADWRLAHTEKGEYISEYAAALSLLAAEIVAKSADSIRAREERGLRNLIEALISSGVAMCIAGSSRPASGSEHLFSHALDAIYPGKSSLHGEQCGVGTIAAAYLHGMPWQKVRDTLKAVGAPTTAKELGVPADVLVEALVRAKDIRSDRFTILNQVELTDSVARKLATETGLI